MTLPLVCASPTSASCGIASPAGITGIKPSRQRLFTEADYQKLVAHLGQRATPLRPPRGAPGVPVSVSRALARSQSRRLRRQVDQQHRPVVKLDLERPATGDTTPSPPEPPQAQPRRVKRPKGAAS